MNGPSRGQKNCIKPDFKPDILLFSWLICVYLRHVVLITVRNVVEARLCFHRHLSFCSQREGVCIPACTGLDTPLDRHSLLADTPPPQADTPQADTPPPPWPPGMHSCCVVTSDFGNLNARDANHISRAYPGFPVGGGADHANIEF